MRVFGLILSIFLLFGFTKSNKEEYVVIDSKKFTVKGSTTFGDFTCNYDLQAKDTLFLNQKSGLYCKVVIKEFGCGNFLLNRDFRKTLKENEHPEAIIYLSDIRKDGEKYLYTLNLNLAGKQRIFNNLSFKKENRLLKGSIDLKFSDFDLKAPSKLGGAIKVKEEIKLSFSLNTTN
jgi:hypothetical protein